MIFLPRPLLKVGLNAVFGLLIKVSPGNRVVLRLPLCKIIAVAVDKRPAALAFLLFLKKKNKLTHSSSASLIY